MPMKPLLYTLLLCFFVSVASAQQYFGEKITDQDAIAATELPETLADEESVETKVRGEVTGVCQMKGCWMTVNVGNNREMMVRFKDYGFFVPKDITGQTVVIVGEALVETVSVDDQRHLAEDAGQSAEEIEKITEPKSQLSFVADGVIVEE
ncbi:DUF4920 domain-containing protein [Tunicatimonas pelagia]|uniref:DUF4920 domain-containing protein n=1 Tax=Tunicatimonas pelagia TaxID=931531 RepID=UPI002665258B|nr:DUF4920 domain-containing protein [Tunicatimonas pelagia]WKN45009.1 DUF4920 domain-containing protein [Tunicatimonas pelagia]